MNSIIKNQGNILAAVFAFVITVSLFAVVGDAFASESIGGARSVNVKFQDLNIRSPAGAAALYTRIHVAAQSVCQSVDQTLVNYAPNKKCVEETEANSVAKVNAPALTAYYEQKTGKVASVLSAKLMK
jgi:UrcA family protein